MSEKTPIPGNSEELPEQRVAEENAAKDVETELQQSSEELGKIEQGWLNPERILELKEKYEQLLNSEKRRRDKVQPDLLVSSHYKDILKTHVIESSLSKAASHAQFAQEKYGVGKSPHEPTEEVKQRMAQLMDTPYEELEERIKELPKFKIGQKVKILLSDSKPDEGWIVEGTQQKFDGDRYVKINKKTTRGSRNQRFIKEDKLFDQQEQLQKDEINKILESINTHLGKEVKIKMPDGTFIDGRDPAVSSKGEVYVYYDVYEEKEGKQVKRPWPERITTTADKFLSWQEEADRQKEESKQKLRQLEEQLDKYIGEEVRVEDSNGNELHGYKLLRYLKDEGQVVIAGSDKEEKKIPLKVFMDWQKATAEETRVGEEASESTEQEGQSEIEENPLQEELQELEKLPTKEQEYKALSSWWDETMKKWESHGTAYRIATGFLGLYAVATALFAAPLWPVDYAAYRAFRKRKLDKMKDQLRKQLADSGT